MSDNVELAKVKAYTLDLEAQIADLTQAVDAATTAAAAAAMATAAPTATGLIRVVCVCFCVCFDRGMPDNPPHQPLV